MNPIDNKSTLLDFFTAQVYRYSEQKIVCFNHHWMSYSEIDKISSAICGQLIACGITKGDTVGLYLTRCLEMPAIILGILKSGAICVPFDCHYPIEQLKLMQEKTQLQLLLTSEALLYSAKKVTVTTHVIDIHHQPAVHPVNITLKDSAYVLFTSGTTKSANAVLKTHQALIKPLVPWINKKSAFSSDSRMLLRAPFTHSPFLWELLFPLVSGTPLIIAPQESLYNLSQLAQIIKHHHITHLCLSPAHIQALVESAELTQLTSLQEVECSGEALPLRLIKQFKKQSSATLLSTYGCTEVSSVATHTFTKADDGINYIGAINSNISLYLLDSNGEPVADGEIGEIYITGDQISTGYLNDAEQTHKHFVRLKHLKNAENLSDKVFFKTGDLGRKLATGAYEFIGRIDRQLQIHGFRVEPQEIESVLNSHDNVKDSLVLAHLQNQQIQLVAYIIPKTLETVDSYDLRQFLLKALARHKVPSLYIPINEFPRNQHHKIAYKKLIDPQTFINARKQNNEVKTTKTQQRMIEIWADVLNVSSIFVEDDFFLIGGDSLTALNLLYEIKIKMDCDVSLDTLFIDSTVKGLAQYIDKQIQAHDSLLLSSKADDVDEHLFIKLSYFDTIKKVVWIRYIFLYPYRWGRSLLWRILNLLDNKKDGFQNSSDLSAYTLPKSVFFKQKIMVVNWRGEVKSNNGFVMGYNTKGTKQAIFWCCNSHYELILLAKIMGADQPVYGVRAAGLIFKSWEEPHLTACLARLYINEIKSIPVKGPYILGGNCQAADIAKSMADQLHSEGYSIARLILLNIPDMIQENLDYPLSLFLGEKDKSNPFYNKTESLSRWKMLFPAYDLQFVTGSHSEHFRIHSEFLKKLKEKVKNHHDCK